MLGIVVLIVVIVVLIVEIVVLIPSNLIENSAVCINVRGTLRTITTRILHSRCSSVQVLLGFLLRMMVQADFQWWIATTIHHEVWPDGRGGESVDVDARAAGVQHVCGSGNPAIPRVWPIGYAFGGKTSAKNWVKFPFLKPWKWRNFPTWEEFNVYTARGETVSLPK
jgi:hypothetical protein